MTHALATYTQNIAMVIIFTTFVNLIMPSGDFEKYIKIVLGLIVVITILAPINTILFKNKPNYTDILKRYQLDIEQTTAQVEGSIFLEAQKDIILDDYGGKLTAQMIEIVEKDKNVEVISMALGFNEDRLSPEFGKVTEIDMIIQYVTPATGKNNIRVPKIKVGTKKDVNHHMGDLEGQKEKSIKTSLIDFYNLSNVNINITVQKNS